jgi:membrane associated rhomboid family serine protease
LNLNHILLFLAVVSPLLVIARAWRPGTPYHGWRLVALVVLGATGIAWFLWPDVAGYIGGGTWFLLLFLPAIGLRRMTQLAIRGNYQLAANLGTALQLLHPSRELREQVRLFRRLESNPALRTNFRSVPTDQEMAPSARPDQLRITPAVLILIIVNVLVFLFEVSAGGWDDPEVLHRIGALEPYAVVAQGEYWRLFTALFLHGGFLHLGFNLFALYILGPPLERAIGTTRFAACYLISGLASSAGVVALTVIGLIQVAQVIGASGCIMGVVGAWAGFLLRNQDFFWD